MSRVFKRGKYSRLFRYVLSTVSLFSLISFAFAGDVGSVVEANNRFSFDLYSVYKSKSGNVFYSPYSICAALAITYEGARGETARELREVLHFPQDTLSLRDSFLKTYQRISKEDKGYILYTANALWARDNYKFLDSYFEIVKKYYGGEIRNMNFADYPEQSRLKINSWVSERTNKKIRDLIPEGLVDSLTTLVITNAVYFKGLWLDKFDKDDTSEEIFRTGPEIEIKVSMMRLTDKGNVFNYAETDILSILELPYEGEELSMLILLPKEDNIGRLEESLTLEKFYEWKSTLKKEEVNVYLPRFKFETKYFMSGDLKKMGMSTAFSANADFSGMTGNRDLFIEEVIHQAFVDVNEEGTEASAATAVVMQKMAFPPEPPKIFRADHPFIFIIQDKETGNILFMGRVSNPNN